MPIPAGRLRISPATAMPTFKLDLLLLVNSFYVTFQIFGSPKSAITFVAEIGLSVSLFVFL